MTSPGKFKKRNNGLQKKMPNRKKRNTECNFLHRRQNENFAKLQRQIEETNRYKSDPERNEVN